MTPHISNYGHLDWLTQYHLPFSPLQFLRCDVLLHFLGQLEQLEESGSMEQVIASLPEHHGQLLVVVRHCFGNRKLLGKVHQAVNVLDSLVSLLQPSTCKTLQQGPTNVGCQVTTGPLYVTGPTAQEALTVKKCDICLINPVQQAICYSTAHPINNKHCKKEETNG